MKSLLGSTLNTREILSNSYRFIRSDVPSCITKQEVQWLIDNNVLTVVDLRSDVEMKKKPCLLSEDSRFEYYCMPVSGGNAIPESVDEVSKSYIQMVDNQMDRIIDTIMTSDNNVLYFCNAGKDRTGVVSAILLHKLGMSMEYIIDDYLKSKDNLKDMLEEYARAFPEVDINVITPQERYMKEFLEWYRRR